MAAARAFAARNPGQPLSVVFFNAKPTVALPLTTDPNQVAEVLAKPPKLAEGTHIYDALAAAVAQVRGSALGAARIVLLSDGDDVGSTTSLDSALQQLEAQNIRVYTVGIESPAFIPDDLEKIADETGGDVRVRRLAGGADDDLRGARLPARERVPRQLPLDRQARTRRSTSASLSTASRSPSRSPTRARATGTAAPYQPAFRDQLIQSWVLLPLLVLLVIGLVFLAIRFFWNLRRTRRWSRVSASSSRCRPRRMPPSGARRSTTLLAAAAGQKQRKRSFRWVEGFAEDVDVASGQSRPAAIAALRRARGPRARRHRRGARRPVLVLRSPPSACRSSLNMYVRSKARQQSERSSASSFPRTSTSSPPRFAPAIASRAR